MLQKCYLVLCNCVGLSKNILIHCVGLLIGSKVTLVNIVFFVLFRPLELPVLFLCAYVCTTQHLR